MTQSDLKNIKNEIPWQSPVQPVELRQDSEFQFNCHKGISCFNACCKNIDITLLPYDIVRLKRRAGLTSSQWVNRYTMPFPMDAHDMPGVKMATKPGSTECVFLEKDGCGVYSDRPSACRYYALGAMGVRRAPNKNATSEETTSEKTDSEKTASKNTTSPKAEDVEDIFFIVKEDHCKGHDEPHTTTVNQYRKEQGLEKYDEMNREWRDIILKKRSAGPTVGKPSARSMQLFDMCSYDLDNFRSFMENHAFAEAFELPEAEQAELLKDEDKLLLFAYRFLKQVLFGEMTIPLKQNAREQRITKRQQTQQAQK